MTRLNIIKGIHYGDYIQSAENLIAIRLDRTGISSRFATGDLPAQVQAMVRGPETDLSDVPVEILEEMDNEMYYCGECDGETRDAKFSETRKHIQRVIEERERRLPC